ncbi:hypothetical protein DMR_27950 [Solidesulfovibrio magneticus RS-1]|uniref:Uncharacterized protein n=1 Tax=Solidesulfovibrio magneticus (strain ATCC 700980 / DSM 13731 / RS-1) TaxID=573370 RepID=C4XGY1_SOLM1|nr:hypothetical protein DMR_27950 [Solidesulfovibrio magneticus RS-1]
MYSPPGGLGGLPVSLGNDGIRRCCRPGQRRFFPGPPTSPGMS